MPLYETRVRFRMGARRREITLRLPLLPWVVRQAAWRVQLAIYHAAYALPDGNVLGDFDDLQQTLDECAAILHAAGHSDAVRHSRGGLLAARAGHADSAISGWVRADRALQRVTHRDPFGEADSPSPGRHAMTDAEITEALEDVDRLAGIDPAAAMVAWEGVRDGAGAERDRRVGRRRFRLRRRGRDSGSR